MTHAQLTTRNGFPAVRLSTRLPVPAGRLWSQAVSPEGLSNWFPFEVEYEPRAGAPVTFTDRDDPDAEPFHGTITDIVDPEVLAFTFGVGHEVTITLSNDGQTTTFALVEQLLDENESARSAAGWHECISQLEREHGLDVPELSWDVIYDRYVDEGFPKGAPVPGRPDEETLV